MTAELYERAMRHLANAEVARSELRKYWSDLHGADGSSNTAATRTTVSEDGTAHVQISSTLSVEDISKLTATFQNMINALWSCLDSLVSESAAVFGMLLSDAPRMEVERFFPIAATAEGFEQLLEAGHLTGVLRQQAQMVIDCQPFKTTSDGGAVANCRRALGFLLNWSEGLADGMQMDVWVIPGEVEFRLGEGATLVDLQQTEAGFLGDVRELATFCVKGYRPGLEVSTRPNCAIDLAFPSGGPPCSDDDTLAARVRLVFDVVERFVGTFHALAGRAPVAADVLRSVAADQGVWTSAAETGRGWTQSELDQASRPDLGVGVVIDDGDDEMTLVVSTATGVYERRIPSATPLGSEQSHGREAEDATHRAVATWGLPDFIIRPTTERKGNGTREVGDGLILLDEIGLVIQVKSREVPTGDSARECAWIRKKIAAGKRQVAGTVRRLQSKCTTAENGRGRLLEIDGAKVSWTGVVIVDHPSPPTSFELAGPADAVPTVVLLRRDWEFLFHQLKSTYAVVQYLRRVETSADELGGEPLRYFELAAADITAEPDPLQFIPVALAQEKSVPLLPTAPAGADDAVEHGLFRMILEDVAALDVGGGSESVRLTLLTELDSVPVMHRADLGRLLLAALNDRPTQPGSVKWRSRTFIGASGGTQLMFSVCSKVDEQIQEAFKGKALLRYYDRLDGRDAAGSRLVGILLTPRADGRREWDTTMMAILDDPGYTEEDLAPYRTLWERDATPLPVPSDRA